MNTTETPALKWLRAFETALSIDGVDIAQASRVADLLAPQPDYTRYPRTSINDVGARG